MTAQEDRQSSWSWLTPFVLWFTEICQRSPSICQQVFSLTYFSLPFGLSLWIGAATADIAPAWHQGAALPLPAGADLPPLQYKWSKSATSENKWCPGVVVVVDLEVNTSQVSFQIPPRNQNNYKKCQGRCHWRVLVLLWTLIYLYHLPSMMIIF